MSKLYCDNDKHGYQCDFPISEAYNSAVKDLVRRSYGEFGGKWEDFVFKNEFDFIKKENMLEIESNFLDFGYKFEPSAMSSSRERPNAYKASDLYDEDFSFEHEEAPTSSVDKNGLELCGVGDNVVSHDSNFRGTALYVRTIDKVLECLEGVSEKTIAIVDDSGGTLTAPVLQYFSGRNQILSKKR